MKYLIEIQEVATKEVATETGDWPFSEGGRVYYWEEGNGSCDCNRKMEFDRIKGKYDPDGDYPCGEGNYKVRVSKVIYDELSED